MIVVLEFNKVTFAYGSRFIVICSLLYDEEDDKLGGDVWDNDDIIIGIKIELNWKGVTAEGEIVMQSQHNEQFIRSQQFSL
jgi:hypothetical protein